jgi:hypothetical protein
MPSNLEIIEAFIEEIAATPEFRAASKTNHALNDHLDSSAAALRALYRLSENNGDALEQCDRAIATITSQRPMKHRLLAIVEVLISASKLFDPAAWGGAADLPDVTIAPEPTGWPTRRAPTGMSN